MITANFITIWYFEELFFRGLWYVIFASFILTFIYIIRSFCCLRKIRVFWFAAIPVFLFGIYLAFLFNDGIKKLNFQVYKEKRTEIVQMVQNNQIKIRKDMELIELPEDYKKCSSGGKAVVVKIMAVIQWDSGIHKAFWTVDFLYLHIVRMKAGQM